jgi:hypothetical protein
MAAPILSLHYNQSTAGYGNANNPNVWNVPGLNPNGARGGIAVTGPNWAWASPINTGDGDAAATLQWYYCTPGGPVNQWSDFLSNKAGSISFLLAAGTTTPANTLASASYQLRPGFQPGVHTCMMAVVSAPNDPAPPQNPTDPPQLGDRHIAQQNLITTVGTAGATLLEAFTAPSPGSRLRVTREPLEQAARGMRDGTPPTEELGEVAFTVVHPGGEGGTEGDDLGTDLTIAPGLPHVLALRIGIPGDARSGQAALLHMEASTGGVTNGGYDLVVVVE